MSASPVTRDDPLPPPPASQAPGGAADAPVAATPVADAPAAAPPSAALPSAPQPAPAAPATIFDEAQRQQQLDSMKRRATGLLVLASAVFVVARIFETRYPWLGYLRATAEAAMVGGVADWFAVTALFRHPMGIPIPHTAIIPARKDRVGRSLGAFVQRNFLSRDVVAGRLRSINVAQHLALWVSEPDNARTIARHAASAVARGAHMLRDEDVQQLIGGAVASRVRRTEVAPLIGKLLSVLTAGNRHQELLDQAIRLTARAVTENRTALRDKIEEESPWWVPSMVDDRIHTKIVNGIENTLREVRDNPRHPLRVRFDGALHDFIEKLHSSPEVIARAEAIKDDILNSAVVHRFSSSLWGDAKEALVRYADRPDGQAPEAIERALTSFGNAVLADKALMEKIDHWVLEVTLLLLERYQNEVSSLISQTVNSWDPEATSRRIELAIGRDLQFIRINGTLVGGLVGLIIYTVSQLL